MNTCQVIIQSLGFTCHQHESISVLNTPFQSAIDGDLFQLFVEPTSDGFRITDHGLILDHAATHAVKDIDKKAKMLNELMPGCFNHHGEIAISTTEEKMPIALSQAFNAIQAINGKLQRWKPKPVADDKFQQRIAQYLESKQIQFERNYSIDGRSGHAVIIPFLIKHRKGESLLHCLPQKEEGLPNWDAAYRVSGQMTDIKLADSDMDRFVVVDDAAMSQENFASVSAIITESANVLPYAKRSMWINRLAA